MLLAVTRKVCPVLANHSTAEENILPVVLRCTIVDSASADSTFALNEHSVLLLYPVSWRQVEDEELFVIVMVSAAGGELFDQVWSYYNAIIARKRSNLIITAELNWPVTCMCALCMYMTFVQERNCQLPEQAKEAKIKMKRIRSCRGETKNQNPVNSSKWKFRRRNLSWTIPVGKLELKWKTFQQKRQQLLTQDFKRID